MWNRRRAPFRRKNNTVLYVNLHRECATRTCHVLAFPSPSSARNVAWKRISKIQNSTQWIRSAFPSSRESRILVSRIEVVLFDGERGCNEEFQRGGSINQRDHRGEHSSIISESRLMKIERKGGENPWRDIARRFIIGELRSSYKNLANSRDVTSERKGKVRVIDKVSNVTLKYRSGERGEKGLAVMVVVVVVVRRAPGFQTFSRDRYQAGWSIIPPPEVRVHACTRMHARLCTKARCVTPRAHVMDSFFFLFLSFFSFK